MLAQTAIILISVVLIGHLAKHLYALDRRLREEARSARLRSAIDWTAPPRREKPKSRISQMLKL